MIRKAYEITCKKEDLQTGNISAKLVPIPGEVKPKANSSRYVQIIDGKIKIELLPQEVVFLEEPDPIIPLSIFHVTRRPRKDWAEPHMAFVVIAETADLALQMTRSHVIKKYVGSCAYLSVMWTTPENEICEYIGAAHPNMKPKIIVEEG